ncbi:MAG: STAS domain-containing protein [Pseudomonadota bacterium]
MSAVESGKILVADHNGVYVIKMQGDVRLTLCVPFDQFIENILSSEGFCTILFDLSEAECLDSTTLGLVAKVAVNVQSKKQLKPLAIVTDPGIEKLLTSMGLEEVCELIEQSPQDYCDNTDFVDLKPVNQADEETVKAKVLESHCVLMGLNENNKETFKDLVQALRYG